MPLRAPRRGPAPAAQTDGGLRGRRRPRACPTRLASPDRETNWGRYNSAMALSAGVLVFGLLVLWALVLRRSP